MKLELNFYPITLFLLILLFTSCGDNNEKKSNTKSNTTEDNNTVNVAEISSDSKRIKKGSEIFKKDCILCHSEGGKGGIGPNLTDKYWIHGANDSDIIRVIENGVIEKGMTPFNTILDVEEISSVASYVASIRGTNVEGKGPQGFGYYLKGKKYRVEKNSIFNVAPINVSDKIPKIPYKGNLEHGKKLFNITLGCAHCHGTNAFGHIDNRNIKESKKRYGENWLRVIDLMLHEGRPGTAMPSWKHLPKENLEDLKTYIISIQQ